MRLEFDSPWGHMSGHKNINELLKIKSCGKIHAYCSICKPDRKKPDGLYGFSIKETCDKAILARINNKSFAGERNPNYRGGKTTHSFVGWKAKRRIVWSRDLVCQACGLLPDRNRKLDVHHIIPRRNGGNDDISNLVGLHHSCHQKVEMGIIQLSEKCVSGLNKLS